MDSSINQISPQHFILSLNDSQKVKEMTNHIQSYKGKVKDMFKNITCYQLNGRPYLTWMSKNWLCCYIQQRVPRFNLIKDEQLDIVELCQEYQQIVIKLLEQHPQRKFADFPQHESNQIRFSPLEQDFFDLYTDGPQRIAGSDLMKDLFLTEKTVFQEKFFERKHNKKDFVIKFIQPTNCVKCRYPYNAIYNAISVCSNIACGNGRRTIGDIPRLPNILFQARFTGFVDLEGSARKLIQKLKQMPKMPFSFRNNIKRQLGSYKYTNTLVWRGSLVGKNLKIAMAVTPPSLAGPILKAKNFEDRLPIEIRTVKYISGKANRGVFALVDIPKFTVVSLYTGQMMLTSQFPFWKANDSIVEFGWNFNNGVSLYPFTYANVGRFFNGVVEDQEPNMKICWTLVQRFPEENPELVLFLYTIVDVAAETELKWDYGTQFTENMMSDIEKNPK